MGFFVMSLAVGLCPQTHTGKSGGQMQPLAMSANFCLTIRSSSEWKVMMANRPPGARQSKALSRHWDRWSSSPLTAMRMAWKVRLAGWPPLRRAAAGIDSLTMSTS